MNLNLQFYSTQLGRILLPPTGGFRMIQVHVGHVGYTRAYLSTIHPCLFLRRLLVKPLDGCHRTVQNIQRHAVINNLEKTESRRRPSDLFYNNRPAVTRVQPR